ncbi:MAG: SEL1-like repeat protein [Candidatus Aminicenantales bacterium]
MKIITVMSVCLMLGSAGLAQDAQELAKRAENGDSRAQLALGQAYLNGTGLEKNCALGKEWITKAAEQGLLEAMRELGEIYSFRPCSDRLDWPTALTWYEKAASRGDGYSAYRCAEAFYFGKAVQRDYAKALSYFRQSSDNGYTRGFTMLGQMQAHGEGVEKNLVEAVRYYRLAAVSGESWGQYYLGYAYDFGEGVEQSYPDALKWYLLSANQCNSWAMNNLGIMYEQGHGVRRDLEKAFEWYRKSAGTDNAWAESNLGISYYWGRGVKKNFAESIKWFSKSAEWGDLTALQTLASIYLEGRGARINLKKARAFNDKYLEKAPGDIYGLCRQAVINYRSGGWKGALAQLAGLASQFASEADKLGTIGWAYFQCNHLKEAMAVTANSLSIQDLDWVYYNLGFYNLMKGESDKARQIYEQGMKIFGSRQFAIKDLYEAVEEGRQADQAKKILKEIFHYTRFNESP